MKQLTLSLIMFFSSIMAIHAMSYEEARQQAWFLTDKMAYELNLTPDQYDKAYEVNLDYLMNIRTASDCYRTPWYYRDADLRCIFYDWQYNLYATLDYFFRPIRWMSGGWFFPIVNYYRYGYYYFDRPSIYTVYHGERWGQHRPNGRSPYYGMNLKAGRGMRDSYMGRNDRNNNRDNNYNSRNDRRNQFGQNSRNDRFNYNSNTNNQDNHRNNYSQSNGSWNSTQQSGNRQTNNSNRTTNTNRPSQNYGNRNSLNSASNGQQSGRETTSVSNNKNRGNSSPNRSFSSNQNSKNIQQNTSTQVRNTRNSGARPSTNIKTVNRSSSVQVGSRSSQSNSQRSFSRKK